jgi:hypothetical protein
VISIFIELYDEAKEAILINVDNIEAIDAINVGATSKKATSYTKLHMVSGSVYYVTETPKQIMTLITRERNGNTICLT